MLSLPGRRLQRVLGKFQPVLLGSITSVLTSAPYVFCGDRLLAAYLRLGRSGGARHA